MQTPPTTSSSVFLAAPSSGKQRRASTECITVDCQWGVTAGAADRTCGAGREQEGAGWLSVTASSWQAVTLPALPSSGAGLRRALRNLYLTAPHFVRERGTPMAADEHESVRERRSKHIWLNAASPQHLCCSAAHVARHIVPRGGLCADPFHGQRRHAQH